ncbi:MAG: NAD(+) synthase, partial [Clostridia bacterium]|nr:NAD(+) synthase [Clostridia bacterium]
MTFDVEQVKNDLIQWLRDWFEVNGKGCNAVIGISGGKDSSVTAALCVAALGKERVLGVLMPNGVQAEIEDAKHLVRHLGIRHYIINIKEGYDGIVNALFFSGIQFSNQARINLAPRLRMSTLYAVSQSENGRVINTCNLSEDWVGYSTRYGDS